MVSYYIYYRVRDDIPRAVAVEAIGRLQAALARRSGVAGRLLQRADDPSTWMEVYDDVSDAAAFDAALRDEAEAAGITSLLALDSMRHVERFAPCV
ncbi:MAG: DUF4936 family protein [Proteobacteria bacterium]|nr:DUF4936 family protein [Pseudomonadota bacterium]